MKKNLKCRCGYHNPSAIEIGGVGQCRVCGSELYVLSNKLIARRRRDKAEKAAQKARAKRKRRK